MHLGHLRASRDIALETNGSEERFAAFRAKCADHNDQPWTNPRTGESYCRPVWCAPPPFFLDVMAHN